MTINYPNGTPFKRTRLTSQTTNRTPQKSVMYGNRGMTLESDIDSSNATYLARDQAIIHKKPVPIQIVSVDYPKRAAAKITEAYFQKASTTDYNGVYRGRYLDFEAKETKNKTSFPLKNFHEHQITHMMQCASHGGLSFVLLRFSTINRLFFLPIDQLYFLWKKQEKNGPKSIPLAYLEKHAFEIYYTLAPKIPYLTIVDRLIELEKEKQS